MIVVQASAGFDDQCFTTTGLALIIAGRYLRLAYHACDRPFLCAAMVSPVIVATFVSAALQTPQCNQTPLASDQSFDFLARWHALDFTGGLSVQALHRTWREPCLAWCCVPCNAIVPVSGRSSLAGLVLRPPPPPPPPKPFHIFHVKKWFFDNV